MKKIFLLLFAAVSLSFFFICNSCKKTQHPTNPTPANYRILSYTKATMGVYPSDNYRFYYDGRNRVSEILFSNNDSNGIKVGAPISKRSVFYYTNDTIIKITTNVVNKKVLETDTFITNSSGQIITTFMAGHNNNYQYYGKLLARVSDTFKSYGMSLASARTYTSDNADLLSLNFDGILYATFPDSGLNPNPSIFDTDTILTPPLTALWNLYGTTVTTTTHNNIPLITPSAGLPYFQDKLTGYDIQYPMTITANDINGTIIKGSCTYPGGSYKNVFFGVYPDKNNRPGDFWQLGSFTTYGINLYQNAHLIKTISIPLHGTHVNYTIDGDSKITTAIVTYNDTVNNHYSQIIEVYNLQYETF